MDNKTSGKPNLFLKPSSFNSSSSPIQKASEQNGNSSQNGGSAPANLFLNNPFLRCDKDELETLKNNKEHDENNREKDPAKEATIASDLFKPAKTSLLTNTAESSVNFVFGQNLHERVVIENVSSSQQSASSDKDEKEVNALEKKNSNSSSDSLLFSSALSQAAAATTPETEKSNNNSSSNAEAPMSQDSSTTTVTMPLSGDASKSDESETQISKTTTTTSSSDNSTSLIEAARKWEEARGAQKRKYEEVEVTTGEEDERNILEINCKLYTYIENNWEERGRGMLRLNDSKTQTLSRVVFRASGSHRLHLNTKVFRNQLCEQPSSKSMRLTAIDANGLIKIYLVMGRNDDISALYRTLSARIQKEKDRTPEPEGAEDKEQDPEEQEEEDEDKTEDNDEPANKKSTIE